MSTVSGQRPLTAENPVNAKREENDEKLALVLAGLLALAGIAGGCGSSTGSKPARGDKKVVLKVGASPVPHAEILEKVKPILAKKGLTCRWWNSPTM